MTQREIDIILEDFAELRREFGGLRSRVDRLYWASIAAAVAIGGPQVVREVISFFAA